MPNVFTWFPDTSSSVSQQPKVEVISFGDGYESRVQKGMNFAPQKWSLTFSRNRAEAAQILAFLKLNNAVKAFTWKNPLEETGSYVCRSWKTSIDRGMIAISCDFEQVFEQVL